MTEQQAFLKVTGGCLRVRDKIEYKAHGGDEAKRHSD